MIQNTFESFIFVFLGFQLAYMHWLRGFQLDEANEVLQVKLFCINPNLNTNVNLNFVFLSIRKLDDAALNLMLLEQQLVIW